MFETNKSNPPGVWEDADKIPGGYSTWVCPKCGHLMDIIPSMYDKSPWIMKCGSSQDNLFDGINDGECSMSLIYNKMGYHNREEIDIMKVE